MSTPRKVVIGNAELWLGDCLEVLRTLPDNSVDSIVTDPPYGLSKEPDMLDVLRHWLAGDDYKHTGSGFMGKSWDSFVPGPSVWREALRVLKPGGHLLAFFGSRTYDMGTLAIRIAGFEIRDQIQWLYGSGFPKSLDVSKAIDKHGGQSVAWFGPWFRRWRRERGISSGRVAELFPSKSGGVTGCVRNWELGLGLPTPDQFNLLRDTFGLPFASIEAAECEVIGSNEWSNSASHFVPGEDHTRRVKLDITAPATDAARQWSGWGTALKPAHEPIVVARKPLVGTVAANVLAHGTGALNVDACRVPIDSDDANHRPGITKMTTESNSMFGNASRRRGSLGEGRWPANVIHDGSEEVLEAFPDAPGQQRAVGPEHGAKPSVHCYGDMGARPHTPPRVELNKSAARFFYCAKASRADRNEGVGSSDKSAVANGATMREREDADWPARNGNHHPTVKPTALMAYLIRLVTPPGGVTLDIYMGSGSTGKAAMREGFRFIGIEREPKYFDIACRRIEDAQRQGRLIA